MIKKIICFLFIISAVFVATGAEANKSIPEFKQDGSITLGSKKLFLDKYGIPHLNIAERLNLTFMSCFKIEKSYFTPNKLSVPKLQKNEHDKIVTFSSQDSRLEFLYMSELQLKESGKISLTMRFAIPSGCNVKSAFIRGYIISENSKLPIMVSSGNKKDELTMPIEKGFKRIFSKVKNVTFFPDTPKLRFSLKSNIPFLLQREKGKYYIHLSLKEPCILEIEFNN